MVIRDVQDIYILYISNQLEVSVFCMMYCVGVVNNALDFPAHKYKCYLHI